jgi:SAM-dependent methyltransferase
MTTTPDATDIHEKVRERYSAAATAADSCCEGDGCCTSVQLVDLDDSFGRDLYSVDEQGEVPASALAASLGCGNPMMVAALEPGETVLDLGSGGGIDVILSARRVGESGHAYGLDMTDEMLALARRNAELAGVGNVEFVRGQIEDVPLPDGSVDVVISNCVINLSPDKPTVFAEIARVLRPGGRMGVADIVANDALSPADRAERGDWAGCIAGALSFTEYRAGLAGAGFIGVSIESTREDPEGMHHCLIKAARPQ